MHGGMVNKVWSRSLAYSAASGRSLLASRAAIACPLVASAARPRLEAYLPQPSSCCSGGRRNASWRSAASFKKRWSEASNAALHQSLSADPVEGLGVIARAKAKRNQTDDIERLEAEDFDLLPLADEVDLDEFFANASAESDKGGSSKEKGAPVRDALYSSEEVDHRRRAELLSLIEELGTANIAPAPRAPTSDAFLLKMNRDPAMLKEASTKSIIMSRTFMDSIKLQEIGRLTEGQYFAHVLHTRRVSKVLGGGKRVSVSVLVVVGNGQGTAGYGMGKDLEAGPALFKAVRNALKNLVHIKRFDDRTIFHAFKGKYASNVAIFTQRRKGSGTKVNWLMWKILNAFGITDVAIKVYGSQNNIAQTHLIFNALQRMKTVQSHSETAGERVLDYKPLTKRGQAGYTAH